MSEDLLYLLSEYGLAILAVVAAASCLGAPLPASLVMLTAGALAASGDLNPAAVLATAFGAAILGDQTGFLIGNLASGPAERVMRWPKIKPAADQAATLIARRGAWAVFLSRWLVSPLGPYVNVIAGALGVAWVKFTAASVLGELIWVGGYVGLGLAFSSQIGDIAALAADLSGFLALTVVAILLGRYLWRTAKQRYPAA